MRRIYSMLAIAGMLFATACSQDEVSETQIGGESQVTFTTELPSALAASRTMGDGTTATTLSYAIYKAGSTTPLITSEDEITFNTELKANFDVSLVNGMSYDIVFWADAENSIYTFDADKQTITANYTTANQESYDAFYAVVKNMAVNGAAKQPVKLYRPFAQLNIGTNDADQAATAGLVVSETSIKVNAYKTLNLYSGEVSDETNLTYAMYDIPTGDTYPVADHDYLAMNYILVPADPSTYDVTFTVYENEAAINTRTYNAVPLQRNYKTNIYGRLLTSTTEFNVEIKPAFTADTTYEVPESVWEGEVEEPTVDPVDPNVYTVANAAELAWFAQKVKNGEEFAGKTVKLTANIDLENKPWEPIGLDSDGKKFKGVFDGNDKVISNLYVNIQTGGQVSAGLFGSLNGTVKNLTINNANIECLTWGGDDNAQGIAVVAGAAQHGATIENVKVYNATLKGNRRIGAISGYFAGTISGCIVDGITIVNTPDNTTGSYNNGDKAGALIGQTNGNGGATPHKLINNTVNNFNLTGHRDLGGIGGYVAAGVEFTGNTVTNGIITVDQRIIGIGADAANTNPIVGRTLVPDATNSYDNVTIYTVAADGSLTDASGNLYVTNSEQLNGAIAKATAGTVINLDANGTYEGCFDIKGKSDITLQGDAAIKGMVYISESKATFNGLTFSNPDAVKTVPDNAGDLVDQKVNGMNPVVGVYVETTVAFNECTFNIDGNVDYGFSSYASTNSTFEGCTFNCYNKRPIATNGAKTTVNGCTFVDQYHYSLRIFENDQKFQTVTYTNNTVTGVSAPNKGHFEGINISKKGSTAIVKGEFTVSGNTATHGGTPVELKYRHHTAVTLDPTCTLNGVTFESE